MKPKNDSWCTVSGLFCAGLAKQEKDRCILFARSEVERLWNSLDEFLSDKEKRIFSVYGSPGIGKSFEIWFWTCQTAKACDVLWVHVDKYKYATCVKSTQGSFFTCEAHPADLDRIVSETRASLVIVDGFQRNAPQFSGSINFQPKTAPDRKLVVVSSLGADVRASDFGKEVDEMMTWDLEPWTLEEFLLACGNIEFVTSVANSLGLDLSPERTEEETIDEAKRLVKEKFYFAGSSARWMFHYSKETVEREILSCIQRVPNIHNLMEFTVRAGSSESQNHLFMNYRNGAMKDVFFVSQCALDYSLQKWKQGTDIKYAYNLAKTHNNPAFLGWVVQFDFIDQIKSSLSRPHDQRKISVSNLDGINEEWAVLGVTEFDSKASHFIPKEWEIGHWMLPKLWNQADYDAACVVQRKTGGLCLKVVQIKRAKEHSLKLNAFAALIDKVSSALCKEILGLDIVMLMPMETDKPILKSEGEGNLALVEIGDGPEKWKKMQEVDDVNFRRFQPYCKDLI